MHSNHSSVLRLVAHLAVTVCAVLFAADVRAQDEPATSPVAEALAKADAAVNAIIAVADARRSFDNTLGAIDDLLVNLRLDTDFVQFMAYVSTDAEQRDRGTRAEQDVANWLIEFGKNEPLYKAVRAYAAKNTPLKGEQKRLLEHALRDYRRAGMELPAERRDKLKAVEKDITKLGIAFEKNIREDETRVPLTPDELAGMPDDFISGLLQTSGICLVGMDYPTFLPIMDYCENETTRKKVWLAYKRRGGKRNIAVLEKIIKARAKAANLLGYESTAAYETEVRMSKTPDTVWKFYKDLRPLVRKKAERDFLEFTTAKREHTGDADAKFYPWDQSFYQKRLMKQKYAVDAKVVQEYFPLESVLNGIFGITESLYGLEYRDVTANAASKGRDLWHEDVKLFEVFDKASGELLGDFYLDLHPRENKYGHAACWGLVPRKVWADGRVTKPVAALVCNFTKPTEDKPSLLTHDETKTFFHEFGHGLHNLLTRTTYGSFSGTAVARDFVEAPSQMFEHWIWDAEVVKTYARHYKTGEPLPEKLLQGMLRAKNLGSGMLAEHQFYYGIVDMTYHTAPKGEVDTTKVGLELFAEIELYDEIPGTFYQASFGHLNGYQAGYYGYMWSNVYAEDMFQRFKEQGMLNPKAGAYYREKILARGGTMDEIDMVRDYLGREPNMKAFLKHLGLED